MNAKVQEINLNRNWFANLILLVVFLDIGFGSAMVAHAAATGKPGLTLAYLLLAVGIGVYYLLLFYWVLGFRFFNSVQR